MEDQSAPIPERQQASLDWNNPYILWRCGMTGNQVIFASSSLKAPDLRNVPPKVLTTSIVFDRN
mgnify:CR=1